MTNSDARLWCEKQYEDDTANGVTPSREVMEKLDLARAATVESRKLKIKKGRGEYDKERLRYLLSRLRDVADQEGRSSPDCTPGQRKERRDKYPQSS